MTDEAVEHESPAEKVTEKFHGSDSSSSDSATAAKAKIFRLFGREGPVYKLLGLGKLADIFRWVANNPSEGVCNVVVASWVLFELLEYHLLTLVCHVLILGMSVVFLWSNATSFTNKALPKIPDVIIPEDVVLSAASSLTIGINRAIATFRDIASGKDQKKLHVVIVGLLFLSDLRSWSQILSLYYVSFLVLITVAVIYEKYEDQIGAFGEKA